MRIGVLGLGAMGREMAARLASAGHEVLVWNRTPLPVETLQGLGCVQAAGPDAVFSAELVVSMLANDAAIEAVVISGGAMDAASPGTTHVNMATCSPALADTLALAHAHRGLRYVAAPVLGRPDAAARGELHVLCAGADDAINAAAPVFEVLARKVWRIGLVPHQANVAKIACNLALASMIETLSETGALAQAYDVAPTTLYEVMTGSLFAAPAYVTYSGLIAQAQFSPSGFKLPLGLKDVSLALSAAEAKSASLPLASLLRERFLEAMAAGHADLDWSALAKTAFSRAGLTLGEAPPATDDA